MQISIKLLTNESGSISMMSIIMAKPLSKLPTFFCKITSDFQKRKQFSNLLFLLFYLMKRKDSMLNFRLESFWDSTWRNTRWALARKTQIEYMLKLAKIVVLYQVLSIFPSHTTLFLVILLTSNIGTIWKLWLHLSKSIVQFVVKVFFTRLVRYSIIPPIHHKLMLTEMTGKRKTEIWLKNWHLTHKFTYSFAWPPCPILMYVHIQNGWPLVSFTRVYQFITIK